VGDLARRPIAHGALDAIAQREAQRRLVGVGCELLLREVGELLVADACHHGRDAEPKIEAHTL